MQLILPPLWDRIKINDTSRNTLTWKEIRNIVEYLGPPDQIDGIDPLYYNSITRLVDMYRVERRTFSKWLKPPQHKIRTDNWVQKFTPREE